MVSKVVPDFIRYGAPNKKRHIRGVFYLASFAWIEPAQPKGRRFAERSHAQKFISSMAEWRSAPKARDNPVEQFSL